MSQLVRGIVWRGGQTATLFLLGTVVVGGCLVVERFSELTDAPAGSVAPLLVLGLMTLTVQAALSARARRPEIALAQIRGRHGLHLLGFVLAEPATVLVVAAGAGVVLARAVTSFAADRWLPAGVPDPGRIGGLGWLTVIIAVFASVGAVAAGSWRTVREPLVQQLDSSYRPRPGTTLVLFGQTMLIVVAGIAAYQATQQSDTRDGWAALVSPALLSPVLLGLAAGQVAAVALRAGAVAWSRGVRERDVSLGSFLARRRMARRSNSVFGTRLVIAAAVVAAVTSSTGSAVDQWLVESTKLATGGPLQYTVAAGPLAAYDTTHRVDPEGRWLMSMVEVPDASPPYRRVFADTARWDTVVGDFLSGTDAGRVATQLPRLAQGAQVQPATGDSASMTFTNDSLRNVRRVAVTLFYVTAEGSVSQVFFRVPSDARLDPSGSTTVTRKLTACRGGCTATQLLVDATLRSGAPSPYVVVTGATFGGQQLLRQSTWEAPTGGLSPRGTEQRGTALHVRVNRWGDLTNLKPAEATQRLAVLTTPALTMNRVSGRRIGYAVDGSEHEVLPVGRVEALPFVGTQGMLMDLPRALAGSSTAIPAANTFIVARADTPGAVLRELESTDVVGNPRSYGTALVTARRSADLQRGRLFALLSLFATGVAVVGMAAAVSGQRDERRREAAGLRVAGVHPRHLLAAYRVEARWLAILTFGFVAATGWLATQVAVPSLALVPHTAYSPTLHGDPRLVSLLLVAAAAGLLVGSATYVVNRRVVRRPPLSLLRDEAR